MNKHHEDSTHSACLHLYKRGEKGMYARYYYIHRTVEEHLSVDALEKIIKQQAFENQDKLPNNFSKTISNSSIARKAVMMFKDSYALEFINTKENIQAIMIWRMGQNPKVWLKYC